MPLDNAIWVAAKSKIYGTMGPYLGVFNPTTGANESYTKVIQPAAGPCHLCYHGGSLFVSAWNCQIGRDTSNLIQTERDIFPIDPDTLTVGAGLGLCTDPIMAYSAYQYAFSNGPAMMISIGAKILFDWYAQQGRVFGRIDPSNIAGFIGAPLANPRDTSQTMPDFHIGNFGYDGTYVYLAWPYGPDAAARIAVASNQMPVADYCRLAVADDGVVTPYSAEWCVLNSKVYVVGANNLLVRVNAWGGIPGDYTKLDLDGVTGDCAPFRIRYCNEAGNAFYQKLLLPCQGIDSVIVWDPSTDDVGDAVVKSGFDGPIDVVFTDTKAFAVQSGPAGLKEIT